MCSCRFLASYDDEHDGGDVHMKIISHLQLSLSQDQESMQQPQKHVYDDRGTGTLYSALSSVGRSVFSKMMVVAAVVAIEDCLVRIMILRYAAQV